jgi:transcription elongation factor Elf1
MINQLLVTLVNSALGVGKPTSKNNYAYTCPFCSRENKMEVNMTENKEGRNPWHCWVCDQKGTSIHALFKKVKVSSDKMDKLHSLIKSSNTYTYTIQTQTLELPKEYVSLNGKFSSSNIMAKHALMFLKQRKITAYDIIKYNIGYCEAGKYRNRIIIPTYDKDGNLNYFTGRAFDDNTFKYMNPEVSRDIIANEHLINWDLPIILCEGLFDALAIKRNVIPLLGKNIQSNLMKKLVTSKVDKIYIALDKDAIKQALRFCEMLLAEGKEVYLVDLQDKDPSEMGFENFTNLIQTTQPLTYSGLLEKKLYS